MPASFPSSDRVQLESNERFDLPDAKGIQQLVDEGLQRHFGAMLGQGSGLSSALAYTWDGNTKTLKPGPFQYYLASPKALMTDDGGQTWKGWNGGFFDFLPVASGQAQVIDLSVAFAEAVANHADGALPFVYARPQAIDQDMDGRRKWQGGAEQSVALLTRTRIRTQFKTVAANVPQDDAQNDGWACIAKVSSWSNGLGVQNPGTPTLAPISFFDSPQKMQNLPGETAGSWANGSQTSVQKFLQIFNGAQLVPAFTNGSASKDMGLLQLLSSFRNRFQALLDNTLAAKWFDQPASTDGNIQWGFKQLLDWVQKREPAPITGASGAVVWDGFNYGYSSSYNVGNITKSGDGAVNFPISSVPSGYVPHVACANADASGAIRIAATHIQLVNSVFTVYVNLADAAGTFVNCSFVFAVFFRKV